MAMAMANVLPLPLPQPLLVDCCSPFLVLFVGIDFLFGSIRLNLYTYTRTHYVLLHRYCELYMHEDNDFRECRKSSRNWTEYFLENAIRHQIRWERRNYKIWKFYRKEISSKLCSGENERLLCDGTVRMVRTWIESEIVDGWMLDLWSVSCGACLTTYNYPECECCFGRDARCAYPTPSPDFVPSHVQIKIIVVVAVEEKLKIGFTAATAIISAETSQINREGERQRAKTNQ